MLLIFCWLEHLHTTSMVPGSLLRFLIKRIEGVTVNRFLQLPAACTRICIPLEEATGYPQVNTIWMWEPHQIRWDWPKEGLHKLPYARVPLHQTSLVGPWEGMLVANWLHLCHYPIHNLFWCMPLYPLSSWNEKALYYNNGYTMYGSIHCFHQHRSLS